MREFPDLGLGRRAPFWAPSISHLAYTRVDCHLNLILVPSHNDFPRHVSGLWEIGTVVASRAEPAAKALASSYAKCINSYPFSHCQISLYHVIQDQVPECRIGEISKRIHYSVHVPAVRRLPSHRPALCRRCSYPNIGDCR